MSLQPRLNDMLRVRRDQPSRLEGFVDSSFAFAVTLLVISIGHVPNSVPEMLQALHGIPAFACSFWLLARLWKSHRDWSRHYDLEDGRAILLSLMLVFMALIFVYPLRLLFTLFFAITSGGYLTDQPVELHSSDELRAAYQVYGLGFFAIACVFLMLYRHALQRAAEIGLDAAEMLITRMHLVRWTIFAAIALLSTILATVLPFGDDRPWLYSMPGLSYLLLAIVRPLLRRMFTERVAALPPRAPGR
jgi:uncharacterized membrane protein